MKKRKLIIVLLFLVVLVSAFNLEKRRYLNLDGWDDYESLHIFGLEIHASERDNQTIKDLLLDYGIPIESSSASGKAVYFKEKIIAKVIVKTTTNYRNGDLYFQLKNLAEIHSSGGFVQEEDVKKLVFLLHKASQLPADLHR